MGQNPQSIAGRQHYILHCLFLMPQEKQVTFKWTVSPRAWKAALFLPSLWARGHGSFVGFFSFCPRNTSTKREELPLITIRYFLWKLAPREWSGNWSISPVKPPASLALLRLYQWLCPQRDLAGAWYCCILCWGLCCPAWGQQQLLMLHSPGWTGLPPDKTGTVHKCP